MVAAAGVQLKLSRLPIANIDAAATVIHCGICLSILCEEESAVAVNAIRVAIAAGREVKEKRATWALKRPLSPRQTRPAADRNCGLPTDFPRPSFGILSG
jgi:hypothetical protein